MRRPAAVIVRLLVAVRLLPMSVMMIVVAVGMPARVFVSFDLRFTFAATAYRTHNMILFSQTSRGERRPDPLPRAGLFYPDPARRAVDRHQTGRQQHNRQVIFSR